MTRHWRMLTAAAAVIATILVIVLASPVPDNISTVQPRRIVLIGDSVIDNGAYVNTGEPDVATQLQNLMPGYVVVRRAVDGSKTADVANSQLHDLKDTDLIVLSTGGNDALSRSDLIGTRATTTPRQIMAQLWRERENFRSSLKEVLANLTKNNRRVLVLTIYNPSYIAHGRKQAEQHAAESGLSLFNDVIQKEALATNCAVLEMRTLFDNPTYYANPIEPSAAGGAKIAKKIRAWVRAK